LEIIVFTGRRWISLNMREGRAALLSWFKIYLVRKNTSKTRFVKIIFTKYFLEDFVFEIVVEELIAREFLVRSLPLG